MNNRPQPLEPLFINWQQQKNTRLSLLNRRVGGVEWPHYSRDTVDNANLMAEQLRGDGGFAQQQRMIQDKLHSLDKATMYSYQGAAIRRYYPDNVALMEDEWKRPPIRALINPNKLKQDYDDKIVSVRFDAQLTTGDIFYWCQTGTYWLIYLQDLEELAYFRGDIRKCSYELAWEDENNEICKTYAAIRGPVETKIDYIQKHTISIDNPNYSLDILMPKNKQTLSYFKRYSKFYLSSGLEEGAEQICWRVEAVDAISMPGILEVIAVEYYSNKDEDDIEKGIAGALKVEPINPNTTDVESTIEGETFIKCRKTYTYQYIGVDKPVWAIKAPKGVVEYTVDTTGYKVTVKWNASYSGQFIISTGSKEKTIIVESLF